MAALGRTSQRMRLSVDDHRSTAQRVNQPEVHTERFLGPVIKVPYRSRHQFDIRQTHHGHFTIAHRRRRLSVPRLWWSALAFSVSYREVITITAHNGIRLLP